MKKKTKMEKGKDLHKEMKDKMETISNITIQILIWTCMFLFKCFIIFCDLYMHYMVYRDIFIL